MKNIVFSSRIFQEGDVYAFLCTELNVSSFGDSVEEAKSSLKEAVKFFVEECETMGTLEEVLEEAGFNKASEPSEKWLPREPKVEEKSAIGA